MTCPLCGQRKARRACPALGRDICPVCCGTRRLVEIRCPDTCGYLQAARHHPPAVEQRQHQQDAARILPALRALTAGQQRLLVLLLNAIRGQTGNPLQPLRDADVADAAAALASTLETAARGVIYEHRPGSLPAQRLASALRETLDELAREAGERLVSRDAPHALRAIERGARESSADRGPSAYLELVSRVLGLSATRVEAQGPAPGTEAAPAPSGLILPPG